MKIELYAFPCNFFQFQSGFFLQSVFCSIFQYSVEKALCISKFNFGFQKISICLNVSCYCTTTLTNCCSRCCNSTNSIIHYIVFNKYKFAESLIITSLYGFLTFYMNFFPKLRILNYLVKFGRPVSNFAINKKYQKISLNF